MKAVVIYESMYGNTHLIADAVASGLSVYGEVEVMPVARVDQARVAEADLVVVGGPTHVHGMSRPRTRRAAVAAANKEGSQLHLDPDAEGDGLDEWFHTLDKKKPTAVAAAFDTRMPGPPTVTGRASKRIARLLRRHGFTLVTEPESFVVTKDNHLDTAEERHARSWGMELGVFVTRDIPQTS
jgi:hypothetical protein